MWALLVLTFMPLYKMVFMNIKLDKPVNVLNTMPKSFHLLNEHNFLCSLLNTQEIAYKIPRGEIWTIIPLGVWEKSHYKTGMIIWINFV